MHHLSPLASRFVILLILITLTGCTRGRFGREPAPSAVRGNSAPLRPLAIPDSPPSRPRAIPPKYNAEVVIPPPPQLMAHDRTHSDAPEPSSVDLVKASPPRLDSDRLDVAATRASDPLTDLRRIHKDAESRCAGIDSFEARLTRREFLNGSQEPLEVIRFQYRKRPLSVHMKWIGTEGQGREVVFVDGRHEGKIHILTDHGGMFPLSPVTRLALAPDSDMVRSKSRHSIREAGLNSSVRQLGRLLAAAEKNSAGENRLVYKGLVERQEYRTKLEAVEMVIAPGDEPLMPRGGKRTVFFDATRGSPTQGLPVVVSTRDQSGREVEYYCFDRFLFPIMLDDADFDPDRLFGKR